MTNSQSLKIALVGCGGIAQMHWRGIQTHATQLVVTAIVDTGPCPRRSNGGASGRATLYVIDNSACRG